MIESRHWALVRNQRPGGVAKVVALANPRGRNQVKRPGLWGHIPATEPVARVVTAPDFGSPCPTGRNLACTAFGKMLVINTLICYVKSGYHGYIGGTSLNTTISHRIKSRIPF